jgi:hypothetical protein
MCWVWLGDVRLWAVRLCDVRERREVRDLPGEELFAAPAAAPAAGPGLCAAAFFAPGVPGFVPRFEPAFFAGLLAGGFSAAALCAAGFFVAADFFAAACFFVAGAPDDGVPKPGVDSGLRPGETAGTPPAGVVSRGGSGGTALPVAGFWCSVTRQFSIHPGPRFLRAQRSMPTASTACP